MTTGTSKFGVAMVSLALFFFLFLESTLYYQTAIQAFPLSENFLLVQLPILGASSAGYLAFPVFVRHTNRSSRRFLAVVFTVAGIACLTAESLAISIQTTFITGLVSFFLLGIAGGGALWASSVALSRSIYLATWVATCHASGVIAQIVLFALAPTRLLETTVLGIAIVAFVGFAMASWPSMKSARRLAADKALDYSYYDRKAFPFARAGEATYSNAVPLKFAIAFCAVVGLFAALFAFLYNALPGSATWVSHYTDVSSRIALIVGGLAAGILIDVGRVRHTGTVMLCAALLATAAIFAGKVGISEWACRLAFFGGSGMFAIFYSAASIWIAPFMKIPQLWASMGRVVNNLTTIAIWLPAFALTKDDDATMLVLAAIALFAAIVVSMNIARTMISDVVEPKNRLAADRKLSEKEIGLRSDEADSVNFSDRNAEDSNPLKTLSPEEALESFAQEYGLTPREANVLAAVMQDERPLKQVAADLDVTLRTVQRHLTSIYRKTDTQTRAGLAVRFHNETKHRSAPPRSIRQESARPVEKNA